MFEVLEHSTDPGFRAWAPAFEEMMAEAAAGLVSMMLNIDGVSPREQYRIDATGDDRESLLANFLNEVIAYTNIKQVALVRFEVTRSETAGGLPVSISAWGEPRTYRHASKTQVKSVANGQSRVLHRPDCWMCEVHLDV